jgi:hypothetical protein
MEEFKKWTYAPSVRQAFRNEGLWQQWADKYPQLFDAEDRRLAASQASMGHHFCEWFAAIRLFEDEGWLSLIEKYDSPIHQDKLAKFRRMVPAEVLNLLKGKKHPTYGLRQGPDLFVYSQQEGDWFFCEVKGPGDKLRAPQVEFFTKLEEVSGKTIRIAHLAVGNDVGRTSLVEGS